MINVNESLFLKKDKSKLNTALNVLIALIIFVLVLEIMFGLNFSGIYVIGPSMEPTLDGAPVTMVGESIKEGGDYVYVDKHASPDRGDIVVVFKTDGTTIIKRVIALGGDRVKLDHGVLKLKKAGSDEFEIVPEDDYVAPENNTPSLLKNTFPTVGGMLDEEGYLVDYDSMFLLGDNRDVSVDSRENGGTCYPLSSLCGVVTGWSMKYKTFFTSLHNYFTFGLPKYFGVGNKS